MEDFDLEDFDVDADFEDADFEVADFEVDEDLDAAFDEDVFGSDVEGVGIVYGMCCLLMGQLRRARRKWRYSTHV